MIHHQHNHSLVVLSIFIAILSSYIALDLANSLSLSKGRARWIWLTGGSLAMGVGIWSMHFVAMLAFSLPSISISYDVPLLILSIVVAIGASALTLILVSHESLKTNIFVFGSLTMGAAIAGMHYIGIASMRMAAIIHWNMFLVFLSVLIAVVASFVALTLAFRLKKNISTKGFIYRGAGGILMGIAISGMHYTAMAAMSFTPAEFSFLEEDHLLATNGLAIAVILGTLIILSVALTGSILDRALARRTQMNEVLEGAIQTRDEFLSIISHELKTPLTSIKLQNQLLVRTLHKTSSLPSELRERFTHMLQQSEKSIERLTRLVDDMLDISRISTGKFSLQKEEFDLSEMVQDIVERLGPLLAESKCPVKIKKMDNIKGVWDRFRLEQVITNILTNAAKYGAGKPVEITVAETEKTTKICIKDFGPGIAPEDQERIFQRYERAVPSKDSRGLGLGLSIVKEILQMHNGYIEVISELNKGSEFILTLPLDETSEVSTRI